MRHFGRNCGLEFYIRNIKQALHSPYIDILLDILSIPSQPFSLSLSHTQILPYCFWKLILQRFNLDQLEFVILNLKQLIFFESFHDVRFNNFAVNFFSQQEFITWNIKNPKFFIGLKFQSLKTYNHLNDPVWLIHPRKRSFCYIIDVQRLHNWKVKPDVHNSAKGSFI